MGPTLGKVRLVEWYFKCPFLLVAVQQCRMHFKGSTLCKIVIEYNVVLQYCPYIFQSFNFPFRWTFPRCSTICAICPGWLQYFHICIWSKLFRQNTYTGKHRFFMHILSPLTPILESSLLWLFFTSLHVPLYPTLLDLVMCKLSFSTILISYLIWQILS